MSSISANQRVSKRSLTLNKSFLLSIFFHAVLIFGVTFTTFYKIPFIDESPIINVKFANSSQDSIGELNESVNNTFCLLYTSPSPRDAHESRMPSSA